MPLRQFIFTVRGVERIIVHIWRRISLGSLRKRWKVVVIVCLLLGRTAEFTGLIYLVGSLVGMHGRLAQKVHGTFVDIAGLAELGISISGPKWRNLCINKRMAISRPIGRTHKRKQRTNC